MTTIALTLLALAIAVHSLTYHRRTEVLRLNSRRVHPSQQEREATAAAEIRAMPGFDAAVVAIRPASPDDAA